MNRLPDYFGAPKAIIAGVHFLPLPGSPNYDRSGGMRAIVDRARRDVKPLVDNGVQAILFANEADIPYLQKLGPDTVAAFSSAVAEVMVDFSIPFGVNVLVDPVAGVAIAHATGASFVRGYFAGGCVTDMGIMDTRGAEALRLRANLGAQSILLLHNLVCAFGVPLVERDKGQEAQGIMAHVGVDGFTISGQRAGFPPRVETFKVVREAVPDVPLIVGTGASVDNIAELLQVADGAIVATSLRIDGKTLNPVDPVRVKQFMDRVNTVTGQ